MSSLSPSIPATVEVRRGRVVGLALGSSQARQQLSARELEILQLISEGLTNKEIAIRLCVSTETVKSHACALFSKLDANSRAHAVAIALRQGLLR